MFKQTVELFTCNGDSLLNRKFCTKFILLHTNCRGSTVLILYVFPALASAMEVMTELKEGSQDLESYWPRVMSICVWIDDYCLAS